MERDGDYFGPVVNRVARLLAAGHGGQVLVSGAACEVVRPLFEAPQDGDIVAATIDGIELEGTVKT